jgi:negative regulator of flagellin synthesis FlgM
VQSGITPKPTKDAAEARTSSVARSGQQDAASKDAIRTSAPDTVVLTDQGQRLEQLEKAVKAMPAVDQARVDAVKADIANGNYKIDVENIADILLQTEAGFDD